MNDRADIPGPRSRALAERLRRVESPGVTTLTDDWPIFWERGQGAHIWDVDGHRYIDLGAAFGVMAIGHGNARVARAVASQAATLLHGMGDVHPAAVKVALLEALAEVTPAGLDLAILGQNGSDAVEAALKCAALVTGRPGVVAFSGGYHGLSGMALSVTSRRDFRDPFLPHLAGPVTFLDFPQTVDTAEQVLADLDRRLRRRDSGMPPTGAVLVEPIQGRGGVRVAPAGFLTGLRRLCDAHGLMLIADEIFTGCGRTGRWFAVEHDDVVPDLLCVGKALGGGMPLSACVGGLTSLGRWPKADGEALHTSTFLGHPGACAAGLAALEELHERDLVARAATLGRVALDRLSRLDVVDVRGRGLFLGVALESGDRAFRVVSAALREGVILLPCGAAGETLSISPPLVIDDADLSAAFDILDACLRSERP